MTNNNNEMKDHEEQDKLGILGLGHRSTLFYIDQINHHYTTSSCRKEDKDDYSTCPFILLNSNFNDFNPYLPNQFSILEPTLQSYIEQCFSLPINRLIIPNITLHECYDRLLTKKVIHPVKVTLEKLQIDGCRKVVLFGSYYSMHSNSLQKQFAQTGIDFITPSEKDAITLDNIRQSIYQNQESAEQIHQFLSLIKKYGQDHSIVIACTELSIARQQALAKEKGSTIEIYDMSEIQIKKALTNRFDS